MKAPTMHVQIEAREPTTTRRVLYDAAAIALLPVAMLGATVVLTALTIGSARLVWRGSQRCSRCHK